MIILQAQFPNYPIKIVHLDNAGKFTFQTFINCCMSVRINIEHPAAHTYTQNGLAKSFIKHFQLIARLFPMKTKLPTFAWRHAIMHVANLILIQATTYHEYSFSQLVLGKQSNITLTSLWLCNICTNCTYTTH